MDDQSTTKRFSDWSIEVRRRAKEFVFGPPAAQTSKSAIIENRTAWRIILCKADEAGPGDSNGAPAGATSSAQRSELNLVMAGPSGQLARPAAKNSADGAAAAAPCADDGIKTSQQAAPGERMILAPFAKRSLACELLNQFDYQSWERRGFVQIRDDEIAETRSGLWQLIHDAAWVTFSVVLILVALASPTVAFVVRSFWLLIVAPATTLDPATVKPLGNFISEGLPGLHWLFLLASAAAVLIVDGPTIRKWISQIVSFLSIVVISLLLTLGFFSLFTRNFAAPPEAPGGAAPAAASGAAAAAAAAANHIVVIQAGVAVVFFIVLASCIPALLYYLFERQRAETARDLFYRDTIRMSPNTYTLDEAAYRYGDQVEAVYGHKPSQDFLGGLQVSLLVNLALTTLGWSLALIPNLSQLTAVTRPVDAVPLLLTPLPNPIVFGALGAYFFSLNMLFRRYVSGDLSPKAYTHVVVRQLTTVALVWAVSVATKPLPGFDQGGLLVLAFFVGVVPETALAIIQDYLRKFFGAAFGTVPALDEDQPLDALDGVTLYDRARLLEEGIENVENLAHNNLIELMLHTHLPTPRLIDLVDQAILYLHLFELPPAETATNGAASAKGHSPDGQTASAPDKTAKTGAPDATAMTPLSNQTGTARPAPESPAVALSPASANGASAPTGQGNSQPSSIKSPPATKQARFSEAQRILRRYGIRTATDLEHARDLACLRHPDEVPALLNLLDAGSQVPGRLQIVLDALDDDDWMPYLREWHWNRRAGQALTLPEIEEILTEGAVAKKKLALQAEPTYPEAAKAAAAQT